MRRGREEVRSTGGGGRSHGVEALERAVVGAARQLEVWGLEWRLEVQRYDSGQKGSPYV